MKVDGLRESFFDKMIEKSKSIKGLKRLILFGSFARGDYHEKSDIDLALDLELDAPEWHEFYFWVDGEYETLRKFDLVDMRSASGEMLRSIKREGVVLYEE